MSSPSRSVLALVYPVIAMSPSSRYPFGARIARSCGNPADRHCTSRPWLWTTARRAAPHGADASGPGPRLHGVEGSIENGPTPPRRERRGDTAGRRRRSVTPCCTCTGPSARTPSPTPSPTSSPSRWPTRSSPRSSRCPPAAWSAGSLTASRTGSARRPAGATACARMSPSPPRARSWPPPSEGATGVAGGRRPVASRPRGVAAAWRSSTRAPGRPWCAPLAAHLGGARSRFAVVAHLAGLFAAYAAHRPELLDAWRAGDDADVPADLRWQPELWRAPARADRRPGSGGAARRRGRGAASATPRSPPCRSGCRCSAPPACPADHLAVLAALARAPRRPPVAAAPLPRTVGPGRAGRRRACPPAAPTPPPSSPRHPLLAALGRDVRELQLRLAGRPGRPTPTIPVRTSRRPRCCSACNATCATTGARGRPRARPRTTGRSQVHACHGPHRQVEVLREIVLGLLADDPTLEPRDVLIACPDVETFAPLVSAAFGLDPDGVPDERPPGPPAGGPARRPRAAAGEPAAGRRRASAGARRRPAHGVRGARPARGRPGPAPLRPRRRRPGPVARPRHPRRRAVGAVRAAPPPVPARRLPAEHLGRRARPAAARRRDGGRALAGHGAAARRRRVGRRRPARPARRVRRPARRGAGRPVRRTSAGRLGRRPRRRPRRADGHHPRRRLADEPGPGRARRRRARGRAAATALHLADVRGLLAERLRGRPGRANFRTGTSHRRDDGADALGAAPGDLPARPRRRRVPASGRGRRRRRARPRPPRRRARPAQRRPPAAARRGVCGDRAPRRPLLGRRRADRRPPPARRAARRAARRRRRHRRPGRRRPHRRPAPPAALRRPQLHRRRARRTGAVQLRPRRAGRVPGQLGREGVAPAVPPGSAAGRPRDDRRARRPRQLRRAPGEAVPAAEGRAADQRFRRRPRRRPARRPGRPAALGGRRPAAARPARRSGRRPLPRRGVAARRAAARRAGHAWCSRRCSTTSRSWSRRAPGS